jgi:hypothetical protein
VLRQKFTPSRFSVKFPKRLLQKTSRHIPVKNLFA